MVIMERILRLNLAILIVKLVNVDEISQYYWVF